MILSVAVVFVILAIAVNLLGYYRGSFSVAGAETTGETGVRHPAAVGAGAGLVVLLLLALLYVGITRWEWFGRPEPTVVTMPQKASPAPVLGGVGTTPSAGTGGPSASPSPTK